MKNVINVSKMPLYYQQEYAILQNVSLLVQDAYRQYQHVHHVFKITIFMILNAIANVHKELHKLNLNKIL